MKTKKERLRWTKIDYGFNNHEAWLALPMRSHPDFGEMIALVRMENPRRYYLSPHDESLYETWVKISSGEAHAYRSPITALVALKMKEAA